MPHSRFPVAILVLGLGASACSSGDKHPGSAASKNAIECGTPGVICYEFGPVDVPPGGEWQGFQAIDVGNDADVAIIGMEIEQEGTLSHHFIVSLWGDTTPPPLAGPYDLFGADGLKFVSSALGATLVGSVFRYVRIETGKYVGVTLPAHSYIVNNGHYVNTSATLATGRTAVRIRTVPRSEVRFATKNALPGTTAIDVPPGMTKTVTASWTPPSDVAVLLMTSHMHRHGRLFEAWQTVSGVRTKLYSTTSYESPPLDFFTGTGGTSAVVLRPAAGDMLDFACTHQNDDLSIDLVYGPSAMTNEMCVLPIYYIDEPDAFLALVQSAPPDAGPGFTYEIVPNGG